MREGCKLSELFAGVAAVIMALLSSPWIHAQADTGTVVGIVRDEGGSGLGDVKMILKSEAPSIARTTLTQDDGRYIFTAVRSGAYTVSAEPEKFARAVQTGVIVNVQQQVTVDFSLHAVAASGAPVPSQGSTSRSQDASLGDVIASGKLDTLPVNNRNYMFLARLAAGVLPSQASAKGLSISGSFAANGLRLAQNNYLLDGVDNNSHLIDFLTGNAFVVLPSLDAIQEFRVQGPNYSAALGGSMGAVLNVTTQSGSNRLHGSVWDYFGNDRLNATDFFDNAAGVKKAEFRKNQYGATLGGPIVLGKRYDGRDKSFFFVDYQGTSIREGVPTVASVPTVAERNSGFSDFSDLMSAQAGCTRGPDLLGRTVSCGQIFDPATTRLVLAGGVDPVTGLTASSTGYVRDPFPGNLISPSRLDPAAAGLLSLYPVPNGSGIYNNYTTNAYRTVDARAFDVRIDHILSGKDQLFGRFSYYDDPQRQAGPFAGVADGGGYTQVASSRNAALSETHTISPAALNEFRIGLNRIHAGRVQPYASDLSDIPGQYGIGAIPQLVGNGGLPTLVIGSYSPLGSSPFLYADDFNTTLQASENYTRTFRNHTLRAGGEVQQIRMSTLQPPYSRGQLSFAGNFTSIPNALDATTGVAQLLLRPVAATTINGANFVGGPNQVLASDLSNFDEQRNYFAAYVADDWKVTPKLTVNASFRLEDFQPIKARSGAEANFIPGEFGTGAQYLIPVGRGADVLPTSFTNTLINDGIKLVYTQRGNLVKNPSRNYSPRLALAYQITPKLVARAGGGIYYGGLENEGTLTNLGGNYPFQVNYAVNSPSDGAPIIYPLTGTNATLESGLVGLTLNSSLVNAKWLTLRGVQQNFKTPYAEAANFNLAYELNPQSLVELSLVGTLGRHLEVNPGLNEVSILLPSRLNPQSYAPFPDFAYGSSYLATEGSSYYYGARLSFTRKLSNGLSFLGDYTYSKTRTDAHDLLTSGGDQPYRAPYIPGFGIQSDYGWANFDIRNAMHLSGAYELPLGAGKRFLGKNSGILERITGGWNVSWILTLDGGQPVTIPCNIVTAAGVGCYALLVSGQDPTAGTHQANQFWNAAAFANPVVATSVGQSDLSPLGGAPAQVTGPGFRQLDLALRKSFRTTENTHLEVRIEAYNISNHPNFAQPTNLNFSDPTSFGLSNSTRDNLYGARQIQFAVKFYF